MIIEGTSYRCRTYGPLFPCPLLFVAALICLGQFFFTEPLQASDMITIGAVENVVIECRGIPLPARIDTGASTTSLDARNLNVTGNTVTFSLPPEFGGPVITAPIVDWKYIRNSRSRERRPVVEMELCIASKKLRARVNLTDRSNMEFPMIIGRNVLTGNFLVDTSRSYTTPPLHDVQETGQ